MHITVYKQWSQLESWWHHDFRTWHLPGRVVVNETTRICALKEMESQVHQMVFNPSKSTTCITNMQDLSVSTFFKQWKPCICTSLLRSQPFKLNDNGTLCQSVNCSPCKWKCGERWRRDSFYLVDTHYNWEFSKDGRWKLSGQLWCQGCQLAMKYIPLKNTLLRGWGEGLRRDTV